MDQRDGRVPSDWFYATLECLLRNLIHVVNIGIMLQVLRCIMCFCPRVTSANIMLTAAEIKQTDTLESLKGHNSNYEILNLNIHIKKHWSDSFGKSCIYCLWQEKSFSSLIFTIKWSKKERTGKKGKKKQKQNGRLRCCMTWSGYVS